MKNTCILYILFSMSIPLNAQNRAPSTWLRYTPDGSGDICIANIKVAKSTLYTYFSVMNWNAGMEGGGYCGIQDHPDGKNFIFSLWDPSNHQAITAPYKAIGTQIENFGGEGTGLKSWNFQMGWIENHNYTIVTRAWQFNGHTYFGFWSFDATNQKWTHIVTMDYPVPNVYFTGGMAQFMEDWVGSGQNIRKVMFNNIWKRYVNSGWKNFNGSNFDVNQEAATANYNNNFDAGIESGYFYMQAGGNTSPSVGVNANLTLPTSPELSPSNPTVEIASSQFNYDVASKTLTVNWEIAQSKAPQFSYEVALYDNSNLTGTPLALKADKIPHQRMVGLITPTLMSGTYSLKIGITDIFDNSSYIIVDVPLGSKNDQTINFPSIPDKSLTDPSFGITAASSSGLPIVYIESLGKVSIVNSQVTLIKPGRTSIVAMQSGNANFNEATPVTQSFCINPARPIVTTQSQSGSVLLSSNAEFGNQWFLNNVVVQGATDKTLMAIEPGVYKVQISLDDCKSPFSDEQSIVITGGISHEPQSQITLYPNPTENHLMIKLPDDNKLKSLITFESTGKVLNNSSTHDKEMTLDISSYAQGLYYIQVHTENDQYTFRFVKK